METLEARFLLFSVPIHIELTNEALPFLNTQTSLAISAEQAIVDTVGAFNDANHFDNNKFAQSVANINEQLSEAVAAANPNSFSGTLAAGNFGHGLHTAEDFYSHSNWVNLGQTTLFDDTTGYWVQPAPYSVRDGAMIVQGPSPYGPGSVTRSGLSVTVNTGSTTYPGVVTGQFGLLPSDSPPEAVITHEELNKDSPGKPLHAEARALAVQQVRHEFYRLVELVRQTYGSAQGLLDAWVATDATSQQQAKDLLAAESLSLGTVSADGTLTLHMGASAGQRGAFVDATDGNEAFRVEHISGSPSTGGGEVVAVSWNGYTQTFTAKSIIADGGAGDDALTLVGVQAATQFTGGSGQDQLLINAPASSPPSSFTIDAQQVSLGTGITQFASVKQLSVNGSAADDRFNVRATAPATALQLNGGGGNDAFLFDSNGSAAGGTVNGVQSKVTVAGGAGVNRLVLEDSSDTSANRVTINSTSIGAGTGDTLFGAGGSIDYSGVNVVTVSLPSATTGDTVRLTPSVRTAFNIYGNGPSQPGRLADQLLIDVTGLGKYKKSILTQNSGAWLFSDRLAVHYSGVESVKKA